MEIVTKKKMMLFSGTAHPALARRSRRTSAIRTVARQDHPVRLGRDLLPLRGERPRRRRLHHPDARRPGQRVDHGAAHHDRRDEARERQAHHRGRPVLRLLATGQEGPRARTDLREARRRPAHGRRARTGSSRSTCTPARSRAIFDFPFDHLTALPVLTKYLRGRARRCTTRTSSSWRPTPAGSRPPSDSREYLHADLAFLLQAAVAPRGATRSTRWRWSVRSTGRPCVLVDDMIDTAGTVARARRALAQHRARARSTRPRPTACSRARPSRTSRRRRSRRSSSPTPCRSPRSKPFGKLKVLSIAPLIADALRAVFEDTSVSEIFQRRERRRAEAGTRSRFVRCPFRSTPGKGRWMELKLSRGEARRNRQGSRAQAAGRRPCARRSSTGTARSRSRCPSTPATCPTCSTPAPARTSSWTSIVDGKPAPRDAAGGPARPHPRPIHPRRLPRGQPRREDHRSGPGPRGGRVARREGRRRRRAPPLGPQVECLPTDVPEAIEVDISTSRDRRRRSRSPTSSAPPGCTILTDPTSPSSRSCSRRPSVEEEEAEVAEGEELAEGEAAEGEEGAAAEGGGADASSGEGGEG